MKIAVLCNFPLGIPAIDYLIGKDNLVGLACPAIPSDNFFRLQMIAQEKNLPFGIIEENNLDNTLQEWLSQCKPDLVLVFTFPYKIPAKILKIPKHGFYNFHTGLLPEYRGGDPIFWEIFKGESHGAITVHKVTEEFDQGPIVHVEKLEIFGEDTYGQHVQKLALTNRKACEILVENFNTVKPYAQDEQKAKSYSKPNFLDLIIKWDEYTAGQIKSLVRAANPTYGGAITFFRGVPVHLLQIAVGSSKTPPDVAPGTIVSVNKDGIIVLSKDKKLIRLDVLYTEDGFFSGGKLASTFNIKEKEQFTPPPMPAEE